MAVSSHAWIVVTDIGAAPFIQTHADTRPGAGQGADDRRIAEGVLDAGVTLTAASGVAEGDGDGAGVYLPARQAEAVVAGHRVALRADFPLASDAMLVFGAVARERVAAVHEFDEEACLRAPFGALEKVLDECDVDLRDQGLGYIRPLGNSPAQRGRALGTALALLGERPGETWGAGARVAEFALASEWRMAGRPGADALEVYMEAIRQPRAAPFATLGILQSVDAWESHFWKRPLSPEAVAWLACGLHLRMDSAQRKFAETSGMWNSRAFMERFTAGVTKAILGWDGKAVDRLRQAMHEVSGQVRVFNEQCPASWEAPRLVEAVKSGFVAGVMAALRMREAADRLAEIPAGRGRAGERSRRRG